MEGGLTSSQVGVWAIGFLFIWYAVETLWDLRKSLVLPIWLVLPPVLLGVAYQAVFGTWYVAAGMGAALLLHLSDKLPIRTAGTLLLLAASLAAEYWALAAGGLLFWLLWEVNITGGGDSLAVYAALMISPSWEMLGFLLLGIFLWGLVVSVVINRGRLIRRWKGIVWRLMVRDLPTESEMAAEGRPTIGGIWIGILMLALWRMFA
jgi:hypothetical protein